MNEQDITVGNAQTLANAAEREELVQLRREVAAWRGLAERSCEHSLKLLFDCEVSPNLEQVICLYMEKSAGALGFDMGHGDAPGAAAIALAVELGIADARGARTGDEYYAGKVFAFEAALALFSKLAPVSDPALAVQPEPSESCPPHNMQHGRCVKCFTRAVDLPEPSQDAGQWDNDLAQEREAVRRLGESIGYGNIMTLAQGLWREKLTAQGVAGGEFSLGPCVAITGKSQLTREDLKQGDES